MRSKNENGHVTVTLDLDRLDLQNHVTAGPHRPTPSSSTGKYCVLVQLVHFLQEVVNLRLFPIRLSSFGAGTASKGKLWGFHSG